MMKPSAGSLISGRITYMTSLENGRERDFLRMHRVSFSGKKLPALRHHLLTIIHKMMCYAFIHVLNTKIPISNFNTWSIILKLLKQWLHKVRFSAFNYECCKSERKKRRVRWETTLNKKKSWSFHDTDHVGGESYFLHFALPNLSPHLDLGAQLTTKRIRFLDACTVA